MTDKVLGDISTMEILLEDLAVEPNFNKFQWMRKELDVLLVTTEKQIKELEKVPEKRQLVVRLKEKMEQIRQQRATIKFTATTTPASTTISDEREKQIQLMAQQDEDLEALGNVVKRIKHISLEIGKELDTHKEIIDDMNTQVDKTDRSLLAMIRKIAWFKSHS